MVYIFLWLLSLTWLQGAEITLPRPSGPYAIGTNSFEMCDLQRTMLRDSTPRRWMVQAFYPAVFHTGLFSYMPETLKRGGVRQASAKPHLD